MSLPCYVWMPCPFTSHFRFDKIRSIVRTQSALIVSLALTINCMQTDWRLFLVPLLDQPPNEGYSDVSSGFLTLSMMVIFAVLLFVMRPQRNNAVKNTTDTADDNAEHSSKRHDGGPPPPPPPAPPSVNWYCYILHVSTYSRTLLLRTVLLKTTRRISNFTQ